MTNARAARARWTARAATFAAATTALAGIATAGATPAGAAEQTWVDGDWVQESIVSCITGQRAPGYTARVSFAGNGAQLPQVGETFYVRMEVGLPGLPCNKTPVVLPEIVLPNGMEYADDADHPVYWAISDVDGPGTGWSTEGLGYSRGANRGVVIGLASEEYPEGGPFEVRQGQALEVQVPVRATKVMKGSATRQPQCDDRRAGRATCPLEESGDHLQVAIAKLDTGPMQFVIPFVGILVQKAVPTVNATFSAFARKAGAAKVRLTGHTVPTGAVTLFEGRKRLGAGTAARTGQVTVRLPKLRKGIHRITVRYAGSATVAPAARTFVVRSR